VLREHIVKLVDNHLDMNAVENQQLLELNYQWHMDHHYKDLMVMLIALMVVLMLVEVLVMAS
jgi:hypothetical protein